MLLKIRSQEDLAAFDLSLSETISLPHTIAFKAVDAFGTKDQVSSLLPLTKSTFSSNSSSKAFFAPFNHTYCLKFN